MKPLIISISLLLTSICYGQQITVSELELLKEKSFDDFESIVLKKKFVLSKFDTDSSLDQMVYRYPPTNAVISWSKVWNKSHTLYLIEIDYVFFDTKVYLSFKKQLKNIGYKFIKNENAGDQLCSIYSRIQPTKDKTSNKITMINFCQKPILDKMVYIIKI